MNRFNCLAIILLTVTANAYAQGRSAYLGGLITFAPWKGHDMTGGTPSTSFYNTTDTSVTSWIVAEGGWSFSPSGSLGVEFGAPFASRLVTQKSYYLSPFIRESKYREESLFFVVRGGMNSNPAFRISVLAGAGLVWASSTERTSRQTSVTGVYGPFINQPAQSDSMLGYVAGMDASIRAGQHLAIVPAVRMFVVPRGQFPIPSLDAPYASLGLPKVFAQMGIGIRSAF